MAENSIIRSFIDIPFEDKINISKRDHYSLLI